MPVCKQAVKAKCRYKHDVAKPKPIESYFTGYTFYCLFILSHLCVIARERQYASPFYLTRRSMCMLLYFSLEECFLFTILGLPSSLVQNFKEKSTNSKLTNRFPILVYNSQFCHSFGQNQPSQKYAGRKFPCVKHFSTVVQLVIRLPIQQQSPVSIYETDYF